MASPASLSPRVRIVEAAYQLLVSQGRDAVTTRAVSAAAQVQPPTIYRQFGDMRGLLDAAASHGFVAYLQTKRTRPREADPVNDLRRGWDLHVEFALAQPVVYGVLYGEPGATGAPAAVQEGHAILRSLLESVAEAGRLRFDVERSLLMVHSACKGVALTLLATLPEARDAGLSETMRETMMAAVTTGTERARSTAESAQGRAARHAVALRATLDSAGALTGAEAAMLSEWLDRLARGAER